MITLKIRKNVSLASLSTFRIGGRVKELVEVHSPDELIEALRRAQGRKFRVFAGGSNVVFPDEGLDCLLIRVLGGKIDYEDSRLPPTPRLWRAGRIKDSGRIIADAGVLLADVITFAIEKGLQGLETLSGIPGTVGGAVFGNAGAYGHSMMEAVEKVEVLDLRNCKRKWLTNGQCGFQYRHSILKEKPYLVLRVVLKLKKGDRKALETKSQEIIRVREKKYRPGIRCPGSFFKNVLVKDVSKKSLALV
ncbi:MAG: FAD-binding protein, partial [Candidatus Wolfebacteria bacterium]|nr:FAD-binding protein [Candidatus Wolfebacteria bacterium]